MIAEPTPWASRLDTGAETTELIHCPLLCARMVVRFTLAPSKDGCCMRAMLLAFSAGRTASSTAPRDAKRERKCGLVLSLTALPIWLCATARAPKRAATSGEVLNGSGVVLVSGSIVLSFVLFGMVS